MILCSSLNGVLKQRVLKRLKLHPCKDTAKNRFSQINSWFLSIKQQPRLAPTACLRPDGKHDCGIFRQPCDPPLTDAWNILKALDMASGNVQDETEKDRQYKPVNAPGRPSPTAKRLPFKEMPQKGSLGIKPYQPDVYKQTAQRPSHRSRRITVSKVTSYTAKDRKQLHHQQHSGLQKATFCHPAWPCQANVC